MLRMLAPSRKLSRPHSLLKALSNPVQDGSGLLDRSSRSNTLSPDLLMHLPMSDLAPNDKDSDPESKETEEASNSQSLSSPESPLPPSPSPPPPPDVLSGNEQVLMNSNNNNSQDAITQPSSTITESVTSGFASIPATQKPLSMASETSSIITTSSIGIKQNGIESVYELDSEQDIPAWYLSPTPSPYHPPGSTKSDHDDSDCLDDISEITSPPGFVSPAFGTSKPSPHSSPRTTTTPPQLDHKYRPLDFTSPYTCTYFQSAVNHENNPRIPLNRIRQEMLQESLHVRRHSQPEPVLPFPHLSLGYSHSVDDSTIQLQYQRPTIFYQQSSLRQGRETDLAVEHTMQSHQRSEVIFSDHHMRPHHLESQQQALSYGNIHINQMRKPRAFTDESLLSYNMNLSGRNTPDTQRTGFKVRKT